MTNPLDDPFYYLANFASVVDWIGRRYSDLLTPDELGFIAGFGALPQPSRALLVRMVMRKGDLFRASKLNYPEIGPTPEAAAPLLALGWIDGGGTLSLEQLFGLLTKPELVQAFGLTGQQAAAKKAEQLAALAEAHVEPRRFPDWYPASTDALYRLRITPLCDRLRVMYFGNGYQDWTEFVLSDLGVFRYEKVELEASTCAFRTRAEVDHYLQLHDCRSRFHDGDAVDAVVGAIPVEPFDNPWLESRRARLLFQIGQHYEQAGELEAALNVYASSRYPGARSRTIRVLERCERYAEAFDLAGAAQAAPASEAEQQHLLRVVPRLRRKLGLPKLVRAAPASVSEMELGLARPITDFHVEGVVRDHFHLEHAPVHYVENALINSLFGLLCWEAIFLALPGAFFHPFQSGPADLLSADFHHRRRDAFATQLDALESDRYKGIILQNFEAKHGLQSPFVYWGGVSGELLQQALACMPPAHLRKFFERILRDLGANRTGFPDLIQFWPGEGRYRMIEVKGPGDRLQDNQRRWLDYCAAHGMPVTVCYVHWTPA